MSIPFTKMHGLGNDYVYIIDMQEHLHHLSELSRKISDRHFGVGSDGLVLLLPPNAPDGDLRMRMFNSDGSEAEMCGNAIRCVGKLAYETGLCHKPVIKVNTAAGTKILNLILEGEQVLGARVDMGKPELTPSRIPVMADDPQTPFIARPISCNNTTYTVTAVSMGNPHAIIFVDDVAALDLPTLGPSLEHHPLFPARTNVEFVQIDSHSSVHMRVWERGAGETLACGTGACATAVACVLNGRTDRSVDIHLLGGILHIEWDEVSGHVFMTGPAETAFTGIWPDDGTDIIARV